MKSRIEILRRRIAEQEQQIEELRFALDQSANQLSEIETRFKVYREGLDQRIDKAVIEAIRRHGW